MTAIDRLTIYSVMCFISFCAMVLRTPAETSLLPIVGMSAAIIGIWVEMHNWTGASEQEN